MAREAVEPVPDDWAGIEELRRRREVAMAMGGADKLQARRNKGLLNARERVDALYDPGTFVETGLFAVSARPEDRDSTPADGKVAGFGKIAGRHVAVVANDFTVKGASSSVTNTEKMRFIKDVATRRGMPIVFLGESTGARMPDVMGAAGIGSGHRPTQYLRMRETPWASAVLGPCYGSSSWFAAMSDFVVMRRGATMAVASPKLTAMAISQKVDPEDLAGWRVHAESSGLVDQVVDTDEAALGAIRRFLSYLPSHNMEAPPRVEVPERSNESAATVLDIVPPRRTSVYDVRKVLNVLADKGSVFEMKQRFGRAIVTALTRFDGRSVGVIASNPMFNGGAIDPDACDKATSFICLCDSFNIPIVMLVDQPGFLIGLDGERKGATGKVMNWMNALSLCTVPKISIVMRKTYGQAVLNMGLCGNADEVAAWTISETGFMDPEYGVKIVYGLDRAEDPGEFERRYDEMNRDTSAYDLAGIFGAQEVIDPRDTRRYVMDALERHELRRSSGVGQHLMRTWPTSL